MIEEENQRRMTRKEIQEYRVGKIAGEKVSRHQFYTLGIEFVKALDLVLDIKWIDRRQRDKC